VAGLIVERPGGSRQEVRLGAAPVRVGRVKSNRIVLAGDRAVSRQHCCFQLNPRTGVLTVRDLDSSNGTYLNGRRLGGEPALVRPGDQVRVGATVLTYVVEAGAAPRGEPVPAAIPPNAPWPPRPGDAEATAFGPDFWICGRCGERHDGQTVRPGQKVGCLRCRAVWRAPQFPSPPGGGAGPGASGGVRDACGGRRSSPLPPEGERAETSEASPG
jgi:hypothetical protein